MKPNQKRNMGFLLFIAAIMVLILGSCASREVVDPCLTGYKYGFLGGLWHGIIAPIDLIISLFRNDVTMFAQNNNGGWYSFGFLIGSGGWGILGGKGMRKRRKKYDQ